LIKIHGNAKVRLANAVVIFLEFSVAGAPVIFVSSGSRASTAEEHQT